MLAYIAERLPADWTKSATAMRTPLLPGRSRPERPCLTYFKRCEDAGENRARSGESRVERLARADAAQSSVHLLASSGRAFLQTRDPVAEFVILLLKAIDLFIGPNHVRRDLRDFRQRLVCMSPALTPLSLHFRLRRRGIQPKSM